MLQPEFEPDAMLLRPARPAVAVQPGVEVLRKASRSLPFEDGQHQEEEGKRTRGRRVARNVGDFEAPVEDHLCACATMSGETAT